MKIIVIDNYDSFVYNLVHYLEEFDCKVTVVRNDCFDMQAVAEYDKILLSPGPGIPDEAGNLKPLIAQYMGKLPILGVCLGQQAIAEVFGGRIRNLKRVYHGVATVATRTVDNEPIFAGLPKSFEVGRYHSWVVETDMLPDELEITSTDDQGQIMSLRHRSMDIRAVQFHPESVLTPLGKQMIKNWIDA